MTTCATCTHWKSGPLNQYGFGACAHGPSYTSYPMRHTCNRFAVAAAPVLAKRAAYNKTVGIQ